MARFPLGEWAIRLSGGFRGFPGEGFELHRVRLIWYSVNPSLQ